MLCPLLLLDTLYFNPRSLTGATLMVRPAGTNALYFNPRFLTGATVPRLAGYDDVIISIHAPSRERPSARQYHDRNHHFNPRSLTGATALVSNFFSANRYFNPRSLAGATMYIDTFWFYVPISIHAPSRERP